MGYLDNDSVVVDAILTKHGRYKLANGLGLGISHFALADDGVDYSLWNVDHPSGSAKYGQTIEDLPQIEALPMDTVMMKYKLITRENPKYLPYIVVQSPLTVLAPDDVHTHGDGSYNPNLNTHQIIPTTKQFDLGANDYMRDFNEQYIFKFSDVSFFDFIPTGQSGTFNVETGEGGMPSIQDIPQPAHFIANSVDVMHLPDEVLSAKRTTHLIIEGNTTGAIAHVDITFEPYNPNGAT